jgi:hypothetical protein
MGYGKDEQPEADELSHDDSAMSRFFASFQLKYLREEKEERGSMKRADGQRGCRKRTTGKH